MTPAKCASVSMTCFVNTILLFVSLLAAPSKVLGEEPRSLHLSAIGLYAASGQHSEGVPIVGIEPGSDAEKKGVTLQDKLLEVGGVPVADAAAVKNKIDQIASLGRPAALLLLQSGKRRRIVSLKIARSGGEATKPTTPSRQDQSGGAVASSGATLSTPMPGGECWNNGQIMMIRRGDGSLRIPTLEECHGPCQNLDKFRLDECLNRAKVRLSNCRTHTNGESCNKDYNAVVDRCHFHFHCGK